MIKLLFVPTEVGRELKSSCNKGFCVSKERFLMIRSGISTNGLLRNSLISISLKLCLQLIPPGEQRPQPEDLSRSLETSLIQDHFCRCLCY